MQYMQNPVNDGKYTKEDLRDYALYRKNDEIEDIKSLFKDQSVQNGEVSPQELDSYRKPLAFCKETVIDIQLSTGGDADGFKLSFNEQNELMDGVYYWADLGVYEEVRLSNEELELVDSLYSVTEWLKCS